MPGGLGTSSSNTNQQQQSVSSPWAPAQGELQSILGSLGGLNTGVTGGQSSALSNLTNSANGLPNFGGAATSAANSFLSGDPTGILGPQWQQFQSVMNPIAQGSLNPMQTPGFSTALNTMNQDITNQVNGEFASAGRSGSGLNTQQLGRGLSQGEGGLIQSQYNQNVANVGNAANGLLTGGSGIAGQMAGNTMGGLGIAGQIPSLSMAPGQAQLGAANTAYSTPFSNLGAAENLTVPIAGLGGQTNSAGQSMTQQQMSPLQMMMGLFGGGANSAMTGLTGAAQGGGNALAALLPMLMA